MLFFARQFGVVAGVVASVLRAKLWAPVMNIHAE